MSDELSPAARALLRASRSFDDPSDADRRRVRASVLARVGAAMGFGAAVTVGATSSAFSLARIGALLGTTAGKVGAAVVLVAGVSAGTYLARAARARESDPTIFAVAPATMPSAVAHERLATPSVLEAPTAVVAPSDAPTKRAVAAPPVRASRPRRPTGDLEGEVRLLEEADAELRRGDAETALARLNDHAARYPSGVLVDEREGVRAIALCRAGRLAEGKAAADRFLGAARKSSLATRVRSACGLERSPVD
jgi:hypothetical protein